MSKIRQLDAKISIHALREESDQAYLERHSDNKISIHALREESDLQKFA